MSDFLKAQSHLHLLPDPPALETRNTLMHSLLIGHGRPWEEEGHFLSEREIMGSVVNVVSLYRMHMLLCVCVCKWRKVTPTAWLLQ